jgi:glycosyltransferase involved in cell wall biosynthesis
MITNSAFTETRLRELGIVCRFLRCVGGVNTSALESAKRNLCETITIFCAARFVPYKNHQLLLSLVHQLHLRGLPVKIRLAGDGPLLLSSQEFVRQLGIESLVHFLGSLANEEVCVEIAQADVYMQLSEDKLTVVPGGSYIHAEGMGRSILEAITAGTFVIAGRSGALDEIVTPQRGLLVDHSDVESLVAQIEPCLRALPVKRSFTDEYDWSHLFKKYEESFTN